MDRITEKYQAEFKPEWRLQWETPAPLATKILLLTSWQSAIIGHWYEEGDFLAWCPLPKLSQEQHDKIAAFIQNKWATDGCSEVLREPMPSKKYV